MNWIFVLGKGSEKGVIKSKLDIKNIKNHWSGKIQLHRTIDSGLILGGHQ